MQSLRAAMIRHHPPSRPTWRHAHDSFSQAFPLRFWILQAIKNRRQKWPGNEATCVCIIRKWVLFQVNSQYWHLSRRTIPVNSQSSSNSFSLLCNLGGGYHLHHHFPSEFLWQWQLWYYQEEIWPIRMSYSNLKWCIHILHNDWLSNNSRRRSHNLLCINLVTRL